MSLLRKLSLVRPKQAPLVGQIGGLMHDIALPNEPIKKPADFDEYRTTTQRLMVDGTLERMVRTAVLNELRLHSRRLARFKHR